MGWRGILMGVMSFAIWWLLFTRQPWRDLRTVMTWQGLFVIATFSLNSVTFTLGIVETSASVVLTAVATMPVFAAILSAFLLQERQGWLGWAAIFTAMAGVGIVVADGSNAIGQPGGSVMLGALYGVLDRHRPCGHFHLCPQISMAGNPASRRVWRLYQRHDWSFSG